VKDVVVIAAVVAGVVSTADISAVALEPVVPPVVTPVVICAFFTGVVDVTGVITGVDFDTVLTVEVVVFSTPATLEVAVAAVVTGFVVSILKPGVVVDVAFAVVVSTVVT